MIELRTSGLTVEFGHAEDFERSAPSGTLNEEVSAILDKVFEGIPWANQNRVAAIVDRFPATGPLASIRRLHVLVRRPPLAGQDRSKELEQLILNRRNDIGLSSLVDLRIVHPN